MRVRRDHRLGKLNCLLGIRVDGVADHLGVVHVETETLSDLLRFIDSAHRAERGDFLQSDVGFSVDFEGEILISGSEKVAERFARFEFVFGDEILNGVLLVLGEEDLSQLD